MGFWRIAEGISEQLNDAEKKIDQTIEMTVILSGIKVALLTTYIVIVLYPSIIMQTMVGKPSNSELKK